MSARGWRAGVALALVVLLALLLREVQAPAHRAPAQSGVVEAGVVEAGVVESGAIEASSWLVDDPDAAYHMRRVELALASGRVPDSDRFIAHPAGSPVPWPPAFDALLTWVARLGGARAGSLEGLLVHVPPVLGALVALVLFFATQALVRRPATPGDPGSSGSAGPGSVATLAGLVAALLYAASPIAIWYGGVTRIDHHVFVALCMALQLLFLTWTLRGEDPTDATLGALMAGVVAGVALLSWLASAVFVGIAGAALLLAALTSDGERLKNAARAGLLFFASAAAVTMVPAGTSPWNALQPGSLINLTEAVPTALLAGTAPFAAVWLLARRGCGPVVRGVGAFAAVALSVVLLPGFLDGAWEGFAWASRQNQFMDVVAESRPLWGSARSVARSVSGSSVPWALAVHDHTWVGFLLPLAWLVLLPGARSGTAAPERFLVLGWGAAFLVLTLTQRRFGNSLAVPLAVTLPLAGAVLWRASAGKRRALVTAGLGLLVPLFLWGGTAVLRVPRADLQDLAAWRAEVLGGLRWMRTGTPAPGPWNSALSTQDYGVLAHWGLGHLIEYHARRPSIATNFGSFVSERNFQAGAAALLVSTPEELERSMRNLGARYVVVQPRQVTDLASLSRIAGESRAERQRLFERRGGAKTLSAGARRTALWRLALTPAGAQPDHYPGLERVWSAERRETPAGLRPRPGEESGPVLSIYALRDLGPARTPSLAPPH